MSTTTLLATASSTALRIARADAATWGHALERTARAAAVLVAAAFTLGLLLGRAVHCWSAALAQLHRQLLGLDCASAPDRALTVQMHRPSSSRPTRGADRLALLTVVQLRTLARERLGSGARIGGRRPAQARRADLLLALA